VTVKAPDGTITTSVDIVAAQLALDAAMQAYDAYTATHPQQSETDEMEQLQARIEALRLILDSVQELRSE